MKQKNQKYGQVFGITIDGTKEDEVLRKIDYSLKKRTKLFITTPNPEILLASRSNPQLYGALKKSDLRICDGTGLKFALLLKGYRTKRIRGRELMLKLFEIANSRKLRVYLLGSTEDVIESSINRLIGEYSNIIIKGDTGPVLDKGVLPINEDNECVEKLTVQEIKKFRPDILVVAFGAPKQEIWINKYKNELPVHVFIGVGGSLDYYSGVRSVPPKWMASLGLEWLWRVVHEPKRIDRIFRAVVVFPVLAVKDLVFTKN